MSNKFLPAIQAILLAAGAASGQIFLILGETADTYFIINLGRYVLEHGIPHVDPFTIHENLQLVAQQWLSGVLFWEAYKNFGSNGLPVVDCICATAQSVVVLAEFVCLLVRDADDCPAPANLFDDVAFNRSLHA